MNREFRRFQISSIVCVVAVYLLIFVGGVVRSTGSGMGCPDWPRCFGNWVPPTDVKELPDNYKEVYSDKRKAKNEKLAGMLEKLGFSEIAKKIVNDKSIYEELDFNPVKTWIEYVNRIVGVVIGILVFLVFVYSFEFRKTDKAIIYLSFISFVLVGFEGWLGSIVVSTNLIPFTVTLHMVVAMILVALLIYVIVRSRKDSLTKFVIERKKEINALMVFFLFLTLIQIVLGTQVREDIDKVAKQIGFDYRGEWLDHVGIDFLVHRSFSIVILVTGGLLIYLIGKNSDKKSFLYKGSMLVGSLLILEIFTGVILNYFGFPALIQPVHLLIGTLIFGVQVLLLIILKFNRVESRPVYNE